MRALSLPSVAGCLLVCALQASPWIAAPPPSAAQSGAQQPPITAADLERRLDESSRAYNARDVARALALLDDVRTQAHAAGLPKQEAEALRRLALADQFKGEIPAAREKLGTALALFERADDRLGQTRTLLQRGSMTLNEGDLRRAIDLAKAIGDNDDLLRSYAAIVYAMPGGPEKDRMRAEALVATRGAPTKDAECNIVHEWGDELFIAGRYAESYTRLIAALECFQQTTDRGREGRVLVSLGRLHRAHGRLSQALDHYVRALALQEQVHDEPAAIQSINAIGVTLNYMGRYEESAVRYEEALRRARAVKLPTTTIILGNLGEAYLGQGRHRDAIPLLNEALANEKNPSFIATRLWQLARAYRGLDELDRALTYADRAVALAPELGPQEQLNAHYERARVLIARKQFGEADADLRIATDLIDALRAKTIPTDYMKQGFSEGRQYAFGTSIESLEAQGKHRQALDMAERARSRAFLDLLATRASHGERGGQLEAQSTAASMPNARDSSGSAPPATVDDIAATARRIDSTFLCYWVGESATSIWVVGPNGHVVSARVAVPETRLGELVAQATGAGSGRGAKADAAAAVTSGGAERRPWRELYRWLIDPVRAALPTTPASRLTIVPHGVLFNLPFAALRDANGHYLLESFDLHYVPAAAVLTFTRHRVSTPSGGSLLVGDPGELEGDVGGDKLSALPWARREVETVRPLVASPARVLVGESAGETAVRRALPGRSLLHLATHGVIRNDETLTSYLALRSDGAGSDADGHLTADEVYSLALDADLVVLSACRTALGPSHGDGVIGFTRAFLYAGAASVVATMWDVPDRTTYEVMRAFYARRARGASKSRSLRAAQLGLLDALRRGTIRAEGSVLPESPRLWAGFVVVGEP